MKTTTAILFTVNAVAGSSRRLVLTSASVRLSAAARQHSTAASPPRRLSSTAAALSEAVPEEPAPPAATPYDRFRPVVDSFNAKIDLAVAYGSGVMAQANASTTGPPPLTDFIIATPNAVDFHAVNLRQHPSHYPLYARVLGPRFVGWLTESFGAGLWYVTMVKFGDLEVKYGVISTPTLTKDLENWTTLYVAGRLHKPVLTLALNPALRPALEVNTHSALALALLQLPPGKEFSELALWEQIAGISYSGDPRMSVPGAENPEKVKNIVRGEGVLDGFRSLYGPHLATAVGLRWAGDKNGLAKEWKGRGEALLEQPATSEHFGSLLAQLPLTLRKNVAKHFRPTIVGSMVSQDVRAARKEVRAAELPLYQDPAFWVRVAEEPKFREVVSNEVRHIIRRPATTQSIKGLVTAGLVKSVVYSMAKFRKWLAAKRKQAKHAPSSP
ncbi:Mitochondrial translocator assembly and maintenance protein 41 [Vanrija albida]|uniref:Phosphatidate cytidylyltransferase, mitochondrial n=1 Tax=Vanrija albida TaxID=181172 RepID=A0ABR3QAQ9_9TREE